MSKTLQIVSHGYRCTLEEQDDPTVWIAHAMKGAGADLDLLLRNNAVNYAVKAQDASGLTLGGKEQTHPPQLASDLTSLIGKGAKVFAVACDLRERGLEAGDLVDGIETVERGKLAELFGDYDGVWNW